MKKVLIIIMTCVGLLLFSQVGIGTANPAPGSILDITSTDKGFLPPRLTTVQRDGIVTKPTGLTIYNSTENCLEYWNGTTWNCSNEGINPGGEGTITDCASGALNGTYEQGKAMTSGNTIILSVNVTTIGAWTASSDIVNGIQFSGSGNFTNLGTQTITLIALGTPTSAGSLPYTFTLGGSTCVRNITFSENTDTPGPDPSGECTGYALPYKNNGETDIFTLDGVSVKAEFSTISTQVSKSVSAYSGCGVTVPAGNYLISGAWNTSVIKIKFDRKVTNFRIAQSSGLQRGGDILYKLYRNGVPVKASLIQFPSEVTCPPTHNLFMYNYVNVFDRIFLVNNANALTSFGMVYTIGGVWFDEIEIGYGSNKKLTAFNFCVGNAQ